MDDDPRAASLATRIELFRLFLAEKRNPRPFHDALAQRTIAELDVPLAGAMVLDLGSGPGHYARAMRRGGAAVIPVERDAGDLGAAVNDGFAGALGDAQQLPFASASFDGAFCSNVLEHVPRPSAVLDELGRVVRPGGWIWLSWTNWYSPWGGHAIVPLHYLGPRRGLAAWRRLFGDPKGKNIPFVSLWPTTIGQVLRTVRDRTELELLDARPRYYPSQRWIVRVPGLRELATWNCVLVMRRTLD